MTAGHPARAAALGLLLVAGAAPAQPATRLANDEPEVRIDARGRNGACDALLFSPDGRTLLAAGEDKVVHRWAVGADALTPTGVLAWNPFRERRGSIYALAHDAPRGRVAVAGFGRLTADVAVLDLGTGAVVAALSPATEPPGSPFRDAQQAVWALAFRADGGELLAGDGAGNVWAWEPGKPARLAAAGGAVALGSRVLWVGYGPDGGVRFARRDGGVFAADGGAGRPLFRWGNAPVDAVAASRDGRRLAARPWQDAGRANTIEVRRLADGTLERAVPCPADEFPDRLALSDDGEQLAVATVAPAGVRRRGFRWELPGHLHLYALGPADPKLVLSHPVPARPDRMAFHPDGKRLATADALSHGTSLWAVDGDRLRRLDDAASDAVPVWAVGLTADNRHLCLKTDRAAAPADPNGRADPARPWAAFDLLGPVRGWAAGPHVPVPPEAERDGWRVVLDPLDDGRWSVAGPNALPVPLPWDRLVDDLPRCYTFLPGPGGGVRLAVGHAWGLSVFDLRPGRPPVRVRKLVGHAGYVTSVAPTHGGRGLVSAGRDNTVALWNLGDFDHQPLSGAAFAAKAGTVTVTGVAPGSPADEAGLSAGDVVTGLMVDETGRPAPPGDWLKLLADPRPDGEHAVEIRRPGWAAPRWTKTRHLHRPAAKFVPLQNREWVLYTYRQCFFEASPNGERAVQWVVAKPRADQTPDVFPVGDFRGLLRKPAEVTKVLAGLGREDARPLLLDKYPPRVEVRPAADAVAPDAGLKVTVRVAARNNHLGKPNPADRVELWANDDTLVGWVPVPKGPPAPAGRPFAEAPAVDVVFDVPAGVFQAGSNPFRAAVLAGDGGWGTSSGPAVVQLVDPNPRPRRLFVLAVGVSDYYHHPQDQRLFGDLDARKDAEKLRDAWGKLAGAGGFQPANPGDVRLLADDQVTREAVLGAVREVGKTAGADDLLVVALSGHGVLGDRAGNLRPLGRAGGADRWYFVIPTRPGGRRLAGADYRAPDTVQQALLADDALFDALAGVRCRKLVLLDCCHSGQAAGAGNVAAGLGRQGFGPVVLAACAANEESIEAAGGGGVFATAVVGALRADGRGFGPADTNADGRLTARELAAHLGDAVRAAAAGLINPATRRPHVQNTQVRPGLGDLGRLVVAEKK